VDILKTRNVTGISFNGFAIETSSLTIQVLYFWVQKYAILSYADLIALLIQDYIIVTLLLSYTKEPLGLREYGNVVGYLAAIASVYFGTISKTMIVGVMQSVIFVNLASKAIFIFDILSTRDTSAMSPAGWALCAYCNIGGVFVAGWILNDQTVMMQRLLNFFCNITVLFLVFYFKNGNKKDEEKKKD